MVSITLSNEEWETIVDTVSDSLEAYEYPSLEWAISTKLVATQFKGDVVISDA